jgi:DNA-directed RNA polymerase subunit RPC12/RpoP
MTAQGHLQRKRAVARAVVLAAFKLKGQKAFRVDPAGANWQPLKDAESLGWVWFVDPERCAILDAGLREIEPYRQDEPKPCVQYLCAVCGSVVAQPQGETGLPVSVRCERCAETSAAAAERMRASLDAEQGEDAA